MPGVSVIIRSHNRRDTLPSAIQSVLKQTYKDFEIIVVDDASTDGSREFLSTFDDDKVHCIQHGENLGPAAALNSGIEASRGEFIAFLDDDDEYVPDKIERQLEILDSSPPEIGLVYTGIRLVNKAGKIVGQRLPSRSFWLGLSHSDFIGPTPLVRRECFEKVGLFDENLPYFEDRDMWLRVSDKYDFAFVKSPLLKMREHPGRLSYNYERQVTALKKLYQKHSFRIESAPEDTRKEIWFQYHCQLAHMLLFSNHASEARMASKDAIRLQPSSMRGYSSLILCLSGQRLARALSSLLRWGRMMKAKRIQETSG